MSQRIVVFIEFCLVIIAGLTSCKTGISQPQIESKDFNARAVLAYGNGASGGMFAGPFIKFVIPELVVYENGLVLFSCRGEKWPEICYNRILPERVQTLLDDLSAVGFFNESRVPSSTASHHGNKLIIARTATTLGTMKWPTTGGVVVPSEPPYPLPSVLKIMEAFNNEVQTSKQSYWPEEVALWVFKPCDCDAPPIGEKGARGLCNMCDDLALIRDWPFDFEPPYETFAVDGCSGYVEFPRPISFIMSMMPDLEELSLDYSNYASTSDKAIFRDGNIIWHVDVRPYLPGEERQVSCSEERWDRGWPAYDDTLPFYSAPDPTPTP